MPQKLADGRWRVDLRPKVGYSKRVRKIFSSKAEALRFEAHAKNQAIYKKLWNPDLVDKRSLQDLIHTWYKLHGQNLKDSKKRLSKLLFIDAGMKHPRAAEVIANLFTQWRALRINAGTSHNTANHDLMYLKAVFNELLRAGEWSAENPLERVRPIKLDESELTLVKPPADL